MANNELMDTVLQYIQDHPEQWDQTSWCGTAYCFAGHACVLSGIRISSDSNDAITVEGRLVEYVAQDLLKLTFEQADFLFSAGNSLRDLELMIKEIKDNPEATAEELGALHHLWE